ncbi:MAG: hypothetical protein R3229_17435 [Alphaproteobacteria bacterium]|nr:hypothetical protein [Alphaproteobacteria bacterium]
MTAMISILDRAERKDIQTDPFPHIIVRDALPPELFAELEQEFPTLSTVAGPRELQSNKLYILSANEMADCEGISENWKGFFDYHTSRAFYLDVLDLWEDRILEAYPDIEENMGRPLRELTTGIRRPGARENRSNLVEDVQLDCQFGINSPVDTPSSVRGPHIDSRYKLVAGLLYFRDPKDDSTGGALEFCRFRDPRFRYQTGAPVKGTPADGWPARRLSRLRSRHVEKVTRIEYTRNVFVMWLNTPYAIHGVSPRQPTAWTRKYVNFLLELYGGERDGFFDREAPRRVRPVSIWNNMLTAVGFR